MYTPNLDHRDRTPGKSQWTISIDDEIRCFDLAQAQGWLDTNVGWGLHMPNASPDWLGVAQDHHTPVFIAKFVSSQHADAWHGYPADYRRHTHDIPNHKGTPQLASRWNFHTGQGSQNSEGTTMQPLRLLIPGHYWDSHIYAGRLYLFGLEGDIRSIDWDSLIGEWNIRDKLRIALICAFLRSDYLYGRDLQDLFQDREVRNIIAGKFRDLAKENLYATPRRLSRHIIGHQDNPCPFPHTDTEIYHQNLYVGCSSGLVRTTCNKKTKYPVSTRPEKIWDAPILGISASYGSIAIAAGEEGLFELGINGTRYNLNRHASNEPKPLVDNLCRDCNWAYYSIFASSDESGFLASYTKWVDDTYDSHAERRFEGVRKAEDIFGSLGYSWGVQDKLCQAVENGIRVVRYQPWASKLEDRLQHLGTVSLASWKGNVISASVATFGVVVELENAIVIYPSSGDPITLSGEPVSWRSFPRSKHYENQLHIIYEDRLEILSFNHDYLINQEEKLLGTSFMRQRREQRTSLGELIAS